MWDSIRPGSTVARERSTTVAPSGTASSAAGPTRSMRPFRMRMAWSRRGAADVPSISTPARISVTEGGAAAPAAVAASAPSSTPTAPAAAPRAFTPCIAMPKYTL